MFAHQTKGESVVHAHTLRESAYRERVQRECVGGKYSSLPPNSRECVGPYTRVHVERECTWRESAHREKVCVRGGEIALFPVCLQIRERAHINRALCGNIWHFSWNIGLICRCTSDTWCWEQHRSQSASKFRHTELFSGDKGLFFGTTGIVCRNTGLFCRKTGLFWGHTGLFCGNTGLFCGDTGLFCRNTGLFCGNICYVWNAGPSLPLISAIQGS